MEPDINEPVFSQKKADKTKQKGKIGNSTLFPSKTSSWKYLHNFYDGCKVHH